MDKKTNDLVLKIQDFRAIKNAEIILDGITVVAGVNGSGKSTISKVLYHFLKTVIHYDEVLKERYFTTYWLYREYLQNISRIIENISRKSSIEIKTNLVELSKTITDSIFIFEQSNSKDDTLDISPKVHQSFRFKLPQLFR